MEKQNETKKKSFWFCFVPARNPHGDWKSTTLTFIRPAKGQRKKMLCGRNLQRICLWLSPHVNCHRTSVQHWTLAVPISPSLVCVCVAPMACVYVKLLSTICCVPMREIPTTKRSKRKQNCDSGSGWFLGDISDGNRNTNKLKEMRRNASHPQAPHFDVLFFVMCGYRWRSISLLFHVRPIQNGRHAVNNGKRNNEIADQQRHRIDEAYIFPSSRGMRNFVAHWYGICHPIMWRLVKVIIIIMWVCVCRYIYGTDSFSKNQANQIWNRLSLRNRNSFFVFFYVVVLLLLLAFAAFLGLLFLPSSICCVWV